MVGTKTDEVLLDFWAIIKRLPQSILMFIHGVIRHSPGNDIFGNEDADGVGDDVVEDDGDDDVGDVVDGVVDDLAE